jgi:phosphatidate cytidylyltransferase
VQLAAKDSRERSMPGFKWFYWYWHATACFYVYLRTFKKFLLSELRGVPVADVGNFPTAAAAATTATATAAAAAAQAAAAAGADATGGLASARFSWPPVGTPLLSRAMLRALLEWAVVHHEPLAYALYVVGFIAFVVSLRQRRNFRYQFGQFAYCHVALLLVVFQSTYLAANVYNGVIFFFVPCGLVVCNDSFAYVAGFFFGRTPLIRLSPKKTWEGFVGGAVATVVFAFFSTRLYTTLTAFDLAQLMACPVSQGVGWRAQHCRVDEQAGGLYRVFPLEHWRVGRALLALPLVGRALAAARGTFACSEMQLHAVAFAVFASLVAPFGGFFASGFKRAFRIKDFGAAIPGHGGFTDRM